ncbi:probable LRR receptor-like serine/threonine-protein kinase At1g29720 [Cynara cardunculus var. scolymus]|uniref:probable LRR receptor-like serine/threonine-protein kinase At1g29720 n=1 Tax=Cynara cardunculus var. scolymus TaxID=59895 RepID=UPI000D62DB21|nr:probable LRR receptor-like serine/threonine-protein kinase At1g29720 [Cynara cardunculus var. scolymus]
MEINTQMKERPPVDKLFKRIQDLEDGHASLKQKMLNLMTSGDRHCPALMRGTHSVGVDDSNDDDSNSSFKHDGAVSGGGRVTLYSAVKLTEAQYFNILQSIDEPIHIANANARVIYRNRAWENFYGYTAAETLGKAITDLVIEPKDVSIALDVLREMMKGESWSGEFPVRNKRGERFLVFGSNRPFHDENGTIIGIICVSTAPRPYQESSVAPAERIASKKHGLNTQQGFQTAIASKISDSVNISCYPFACFAVFIQVKCLGPVWFARMERIWNSNPCLICKIARISLKSIKHTLSTRAKWMGKYGIAWPWKGNGRGGHFCWHWLYDDQEDEYGLQSSSGQPRVNTNYAAGNDNKALGTWSSSFYNADLDNCSKDYEIKWEDLMIKEQIGRGSSGTVYHAVWYGSDVALKLFSKQEYSHDLILSFRQEVSLMKRLRHPNILLFMGTVISSQRLCIVTEFLHRGSLFQLLHQNTTGRLDWRRRVHMAMDIARGMNYLHRCHPFTIHCDLKSSNLLVDKNWRVKVGGFDLCCIKHQTYLAAKKGKADEKSDVYSYGVVLQEMTTEKISWDGVNSTQVMEAVGLMNQRLDIPEDVDKRWASLVKSCLCSEPDSRPTFREILDDLKVLQKKLPPKQLLS